MGVEKNSQMKRWMKRQLRAVGVAGVVCGSVVVVGQTGCTSSQINSASAVEAKAENAERVRAECPDFRDVAVKQATPVWCWAASAEMVHKYYGNTEITQEKLAEAITNVSAGDEKKARAAGLQEIMLALNPDFRERIAKHSGEVLLSGSAEFDVLDFAIGQIAPWSASSDDLIDAISTRNPAIVGLRGAGQSMTSYVPVKQDEGKNAMNRLFGEIAKAVGEEHGVRRDQAEALGVGKGPAKYVLHEIEYIDPMDGKRYKLNAEGFRNRVDFIVTKDRSREILERQLNAVR
jgi:hypothetical protein